MTAAIQDQLKATGIVQVIVVLKPRALGTRLGGALESASMPGPSVPTDDEKQRFRRSARELERFFLTGSETREGALALAVAHDARRRDG
jgi:hypothetical protein